MPNAAMARILIHASVIDDVSPRTMNPSPAMIPEAKRNRLFPPAIFSQNENVFRTAICTRTIAACMIPKYMMGILSAWSLY